MFFSQPGVQRERREGGGRKRKAGSPKPKPPAMKYEFQKLLGDSDVVKVITMSA